MNNEYLILHEPSIAIPFHSSLEEVKELLGNHGFNLKLSQRYNFETKEYEDGYPIYSGTAKISRDNLVVLHLYFNKNDKLEAIMVTNNDSPWGEELLSRYVINQSWLEKNYGTAHCLVDSTAYNTNTHEWKFGNLSIKHFIEDRFGDAEGISFKVL